MTATASRPRCRSTIGSTSASFWEPTTSAGTRTETVHYLQKRHVTGPDVTISTIVEGRPVRAGIDPYNILIDRRPGDHLRAGIRR